MDNLNKSSIGANTLDHNKNEMVPRVPNIRQSKPSSSQNSHSHNAVRDSLNKKSPSKTDAIYHYQQHFKQNRGSTLIEG